MSQQETDPKAVYIEARGDTVRQRLLDALKTDLLGPEAPDEVLAQSPATRYLVGILAPKGTRLSPSDDEDADSTVDGSDQQEAGPRVGQQLAPSSIGLSFVVDADCDFVRVRAGWGEYERFEPTGGDDVEPQQAADIDPDADPDATAMTRRRERRWARKPFDISMQLPLSGRTGCEGIAPGASIEWIVETLGGLRVATVFLVNARVASSEGRPADEEWMYQPEISVTGDGPIFLSRRLPRGTPDADPDVASADLAYRRRREFAVGHGSPSAGTPRGKTRPGPRGSTRRSFLVAKCAPRAARTASPSCRWTCWAARRPMTGWRPCSCRCSMHTGNG